MIHLIRNRLPAKSEIYTFSQNLIYHLFPYFDGGDPKVITVTNLQKQLEQLLNYFDAMDSSSKQQAIDQFIKELPAIKEQLEADANFIESNDPAATCIEEVVMAYPGFEAITIYRLAHALKQLEIPLIPRIMSEQAHSRTGIDIHPGATIGSPFFIDHGTGIVVGESAVIGNRVKLYQGVTLGALSVCKESAQTKRHPTIEDNVVIYAGATILGGKTTIGHNSIIGGNAWLTMSIQPYSVVQHEDKVRITTRDYSLS